MKNNKNKSLDKNKSNIFLKKKRGKKFPIEKLIYMYCINNNIKQNEIKTKIKSFQYEDPDTGDTISYNKDKTEKMPISIKKLEKYFEKENKEININKKESKIKKCSFCNYVFPEISEEEKIEHLKLCFDKF